MAALSWADAEAKHDFESSDQARYSVFSPALLPDSDEGVLDLVSDINLVSMEDLEQIKDLALIAGDDPLLFICDQEIEARNAMIAKSAPELSL